jgi:hypothetical protein
MAEEYDPVAQRASFARQFIGTTNLDQRRRFAQDISEARERDEERQQQQFEERQRADPRLMQAVTARRREQRQAQEGFERGDLARQRFEFEQGREQRANTIAQRRLELDTNREQRFMRKEQLEIDRLDREEDDTLAAEEDELKLREATTPGSSAYQRGVLDIFLRRPYVNKDYRNQALKAAGYADPEVAFKEAADAVEAGASRATAKLPGGGTATFTQEKRDLPTVQKELTAARRLFATAKKEAEPSNIEYAESLVRRLERETQGLGGTIGPQPSQQEAQTTAAPAAAPAPQSSSTNFTNPEEFKSAFQSAPSGTILIFNGRQWKKP